MEGLDDDIRRVMARNAEILECRRQILECRRQLQHWSDRLSVLEAEWRREYLLERMEYDPRGTWNKLTEEEQQEKDFVIKALECTPCVFGYYPFEEEASPYEASRVELPEQFREDRDAILAYISRVGAHHHYFPASCVPESLRDDMEFMTLLCSKDSSLLSHASTRLLNDPEFVLAVMGDGSDMQHCYIHHVSIQLRSNKDFMMKVLENTNLTSFNWIFEHARLATNDEKQLALEALQRSQNLEEKYVGYMRYMSPALCSDKELMLRFVDFTWRALEFCSDSLRSDEEVINTAVSQDSRAVRYCTGPYKKENPVAEKEMVIEELYNYNVPDFNEEVPKELMSDPEVIVAALDCGVLDFYNLSIEQRLDRDIILAHAASADECFYRRLPRSVRRDETACIEILNAGYCYSKSIFDAMPSLYHSRESIMCITKVEPDFGDDPIPAIICRSSFLDDREVMLSACELRPWLAKHASERLRSNRDFIDEVLTRSVYGEAIKYTSEEFRRENIDLVLKAINLSSDKSSDWALLTGVWQHRSVVQASLEKGWPVLGMLGTNNPLLDDADIVRAAVEIRPSELQYASRRLKGDREFILSLARCNGRSLVHADAHLRNDDDVLLAAVADTPGVILECFGRSRHFESIVSFASRVRSKLEQYDNFMRVFLSGISIPRPHRPSPMRCLLPLLDQGIETSVAFKKLVAEFAGVSIGEQLQSLCKASLNLRKLGY